MYYVYSRHMKSGREDYCGQYDTVQGAIKKIALNYSIDKVLRKLGEYYYFMKKH